jgi:hypothetical protein
VLQGDAQEVGDAHLGYNSVTSPSTVVGDGGAVTAAAVSSLANSYPYSLAASAALPQTQLQVQQTQLLTSSPSTTSLYTNLLPGVAAAASPITYNTALPAYIPLHSEIPTSGKHLEGPPNSFDLFLNLIFF